MTQQKRKRNKYERASALAELKRISIEMRCDPEAAHQLADNVLLDFLHGLGYRATVREFEGVKRYYS